MKNLYTVILGFIIGIQSLSACSWYDPDYEYFNLFTQSIILDKSFTPFLLTYSNPYYIDDEVIIPDDNIENWYDYFNQELSLSETKELVYKVSMEELNNLKFKRKVNDPLLRKLGYKFYVKYKDAMDYLIQAKYMEPYMRIQYVDNPNSFYNHRDDKVKDVSGLNFSKVASALVSLYNATESTSIKLRYGYQLVRFLHYNRNYMGAIDAFKKYIQPLKIKNTIYYMALDQMAGAQRGVGLYKDANWNFFQVFMHTKSRKKSAYSSMRINSEASFQDILVRTQNKDEKIMAYFLLGYQDFNNPMGIMKKIYEIDSNAEALKVLQARAINELERTFLTVSYNFQNSKDSNSKPKNKSNRIPILDNKTIHTYNGDKYEGIDGYKYLLSLVEFTEKVRGESNDEFWDITLAYLKFLQKDYSESQQILSSINTNNEEYLSEIKHMKMLNEIVSRPIIDNKFEVYLMENYPSYFIEKEQEKNYYWNDINGQTTDQFLSDVLANRYYLQGDYAKSFLMSNDLTYLSYEPNFELTKHLDQYYHKPNKNIFEKQIISKKLNVEDPESFFNLIYGDYYARNGEFLKAFKKYKNVINGNGFIIRTIEVWDDEKNEYVEKDYPEDKYNLYNNIPPLIFGHNNVVYYNGPDEYTMEEEPFIDEFDFLNKVVNKAELMEHLLTLKRIAKGKNDKAAKANQLIGNLLYNTSKLGYFRHIFVMDETNGNGPKYHFYSKDQPEEYLYKDYYNRSGGIDNGFTEPKKYYEKAYEKSRNDEQKAQILFQLASIEQGEYYQWEANQPEIPYDEDNRYEKIKQRRKDNLEIKNQRFRTNFQKLKRNYLNTNTAQELIHSCSYFEQFLQN